MRNRLLAVIALIDETLEKTKEEPIISNELHRIRERLALYIPEETSVRISVFYQVKELENGFRTQ